ncbi:hypothetical protein [Solobacterium moorei]|uniref:hypothetical protein n=1 Tax=Solobacterium moorei TaxID=102148 RepID=UPI0004009BEE|nr:hypothetical protein [Solobacterium moorei]BET21462.1 hypothetical protein RGT18_10500 [Solobacterium moorei]
MAAPIYNWPLLYELLMNDILKHHQISEQSYWLGLSSGVEELYLPSTTQANTLRTMHYFISALKDGQILPFSGPIESRTGKTILSAGKNMQALDIIRINWLNNNIEGELSSISIPHDELTEIKTTNEDTCHQ